MRKGKRIFFVSFWALLISGNSFADTAQEKCNALYEAGLPIVNITYNYGKLRYDNSKTSEELDALYNEINRDGRAKNIHGLTHLSPQVVTVVTTTSVPLDSENICFYPSRIEINMWYEPIVYLAKSLKIGSCRFNVTVRHEQTHLDLAHHALYLFAKSLKEAMPYIISQSHPVIENIKTADGSKIVQDMTEEYQSKVKLYFEEFKQKQQKYNAIIDTDENYVEEAKLCPKD
ncbi:MAG: hypothetical protein IJ677_06605 [Alphaproteobacteria bacterium]|nr:hypothetical protein [Alphaproteobacteria bacterium]